MQSIKISIYVTLVLLFATNASSGQTMILNRSTDKEKDILSVYTWRPKNSDHPNSIKLTLFKNGHFSYFYEYTLNQHEYSDGVYKISHGIIILNSTIQDSNLVADVTYPDTAITKNEIDRLSFPTNRKGEIIFNANYWFNYSTDITTVYFPKDTNFKPNLDSIKSIRVGFGTNQFYTKWTKITRKHGHINVVVDTDSNLNNYRPKIIKDWKFKMSTGQLTRLQADKYSA